MLVKDGVDKDEGTKQRKSREVKAEEGEAANQLKRPRE